MTVLDITLIKNNQYNVLAIPFIDLGNSGGTLTGELDGASPVINLTSPLPIGDSNVTTAYVSSYFINAVSKL